MTAVKLGHARRAAMARLRTVLRQELVHEVEAELLESGYPGLPCPVPDDAAYVMSEPFDPGERPMNRSIVCYIWRQPSRNTVGERSGGVDRATAMVTFEVSVVLLFQYAMGSTQVDEQGQPLDLKTEMDERAEIYVAALIECLTKYAPSPGPIHAIDYLADDAFAYLTEEREGAPIVGVATAQFTLTQKISIAERRRLPTR